MKNKNIPRQSSGQEKLKELERKISELDEKVNKIQRSTATKINTLLPIHNQLRMRSKLYYKWHLNPKASLTHLAILAIYIITVVISSTYFSIQPSSSIPTLAAGESYYVAKNGSDSNSGTEAEPWLTISKANQTLQPGDTVYIKNGTYFEDQIKPVNSGIEGNLITYKSYSGHNPVITYGEQITGWTQHSGNIWKKENYTRLTDNDWDNVWQEDKRLRGGTSIPTEAGWWWYDLTTQTVYTWLLDNANPNDIALIGVDYNSVADLSNKNYITLENLELSYAAYWGIDIHGSEHITLKNLNVHHAGRCAIFGRGANYTLVDGGTYEYFKSIYFSGGAHDNEIKNIIARNVYEDAIAFSNEWGLAGVGNSVHDCDIQTGPVNPKWWDSQEDGIDIYGGTVDIYNNEFHDIAAKGIYIHGGENHQIYNNLIHDTGWVGLWMWVGGSGGGTGTGIVVDNNVLWNCGLNQDFTIYVHNTIDGVKIFNNTVHGYRRAGIEIRGPNAEVKNNIFTATNGANWTTTPLAYNPDASLTVDSDYNIVQHFDNGTLVSWNGNSYTDFSTYQTTSGIDANSLNQNPKFTDVANHNFHLQSDSPAINAGTLDGASTTDKDGNQRVGATDMGAYEYQGNFIQNSGFENQLNNWSHTNIPPKDGIENTSFSIDSSQKHDGNYSLRWNRVSNSHWEESISQTISGFEVGQWYQINFWVYSPDDMPYGSDEYGSENFWYGRTPNFRILKTDNSIHWSRGIQINGNQWHKQGINFIAHESTMTFLFSSAAALTPEVTVYIDDINVEKMDYTKPPQNDLGIDFKGGNSSALIGNVHTQWREGFDLEDCTRQFEIMRQGDIKIIRLWAALDSLIDNWDPVNGYTSSSSLNQEAVNNLRATLDMIDEKGMKVYLMIGYKQDDSPGDSRPWGFFRKEALDGNHQTMRDNYINVYRDWVNAIKDKPAIWGYDMLNEAFDAFGNTDKNHHYLRDFLADIYKTIKIEDSSRYVGVSIEFGTTQYPNVGDYVPPWNPDYVGYDGTNIQRVCDFHDIHTAIYDKNPPTFYARWHPDSIDSTYPWYPGSQLWIFSKPMLLMETGGIPANSTSEYIISQISGIYRQAAAHGYQHINFWSYNDYVNVINKTGSSRPYTYELTPVSEWIRDLQEGHIPKITAMKNEYGDSNFYSYFAPEGTQACDIQDSDLWNIPDGNNVIAQAFLDGDKIGVIKNEQGDYNFYLYNAPQGQEAATQIGADYWNIPGGNNIVSIAGLDSDGDSQDELAVLKNENGDHNLYIYELPSGDEAKSKIASDLWNIPFGNNVISICGINIQDSGSDKIAVLKNESGDHNLYIYDAPISDQACTKIASDLWNIPDGNNVISIAGIDYSGNGRKDKIAVLKNENGDYDLYVYNLPSTLLTPASSYGQDLWNIPGGNNIVDLGG